MSELVKQDLVRDGTDVAALTEALIACPSVTPATGKSQNKSLRTFSDRCCTN